MQQTNNIVFLNSAKFKTLADLIQSIPESKIINFGVTRSNGFWSLNAA